MKKYAPVLLAVLMLFACSNSFAEEKMDWDEITFGEHVNYGAVLTATNVDRGVATMQDGKPVGVCTTPGQPAWLNIIDLNTMERIDAIEIPNNYSATPYMEVDKEGNVWFGSFTKARLYKYSPSEKKIYDYGRIAAESAMTAICFDDEDNVWVGTYPNAKILKFDRATETFTDYGRMIEGDQYLYGLSYYKGKLYYQDSQNNRGVYIYDTGTGEVTIVPFATEGESGSSRSWILGNRYVLSYGGGYIRFYNIDEQKWEEPMGPGVKGEWTTPLYEDGKTFYFFKDGYAHEGNIETKEMRKLENLPYGSFMRGGGMLFELDDPEFSGLNYFSIQYNGRVQVWNFQNQKVKDVMGQLQGTATETRAYGFGPDGRFYMTEYRGTKAAAVDLKTMDIELFHMSQPESFTTLGDKMYFGCYEGAELYILDTKKKYFQVSEPSNPENNPVIWGIMGEAQSRPFVSLATEDKVVFGTVPGYGEFGGAINIYDPETNEVDSYRHVVKDQMPVSLAYKDGLLYVGTSVSGGLGFVPAETDAKIFIFDMEKREIVKCVDLKIPGVTVPIKGVEGISIAPDNTLVGYGRGYTYKMDMETLELIDYSVWGNVDYGNGAQIWKPYHVIYDESGYAFMSYDGKLAIVDYETLDYKITDEPMSHLAVMGADGNLYQQGANYSIEMTPVIRGEDYSYKFMRKVVFREGENKAIVDQEVVNIDSDNGVVPYIVNSRMMIPLRFLAEGLGFSVSYDDAEKTATVYNPDTKVTLKAGSREVYINGEYKKLVAPPEIRNDRLFVHSRTFAEIFGKSVYWDESGLVVINMDGSEFNPLKDADVIKYAERYMEGGSDD